MSDLPLIVGGSSAIRTLRFNRPASLNAIDSAMASAFLQAIQDAVEDAEVRVIVLSGVGRSFMAGGDISQFGRDPGSIPQALIEPMNQAILLFSNSDKLVLGSVQGPVAGAGMSLAMACDLLVAADNTCFSFAYTALSVSGDLGISWNLPRLLGLRQALGVALLGDSIKSDDAQRLGLVNRVVAAEQLAAQTQAIAEQLVALPALAAGNIKRLIRLAEAQDLGSQLDAEQQAFSQCIEQPAFHAAVAGFLGKRK